MLQWGAYWRLMRFDKPVGILLLWYPTAYALWFANLGKPSFKLVLLFLIGTVLMRAAGCVINDIADRKIDKHVTRTKLRPLTAGEISLPQAFCVLFILLFSALMVAINLPLRCLYWAIAALLITFFYPFCKRWFNAPQMVLGFAFSMGIPMAYVASLQAFDSQFYLLCCINFLWIMAYDTMYAMADREDDLQIGVKSTAIYLGSYDRLIIALFNTSMHSLWLYWAIAFRNNLLFYLFWLAAGFVLVYQQILLNKRKPADCFKAFLVSAYYGLCMWLAVIFIQM